MRFPHGFHGSHLCGLILRDTVGRFVAHVNGENRCNQTEDRTQAQTALGKADVAALDEVPGRDCHDEHGARHVARVDGVHEFGLCPGTRGDFPEVRHFHAHGFEIEFGPYRVHHPGVGDQNPQRREVGAERHKEGHRQMTALGKALPAEEEQTDEGRLEEEGHQTFDGQRGAEDVAHVVGVVSPVRAELKLHGDARRNAEREVDAEELAPEAGHVLVHLAARHDVARLHDHQHERKAERKRHEQEVIHGRQCKLQTGQINKFRRKHRERLRVSRVRKKLSHTGSREGFLGCRRYLPVSGDGAERIRMPEATFSGVCSMRLSGPKKKYQSPKMKASLQQSTTPISKIRRGRDLLDLLAEFISDSRKFTASKANNGSWRRRRNNRALRS